MRAACQVFNLFEGALDASSLIDTGGTNLIDVDVLAVKRRESLCNFCNFRSIQPFDLLDVKRLLCDSNIARLEHLDAFEERCTQASLCGERARRCALLQVFAAR